MPYFVFRVGALGVLSKLAEFPSFREASAHAKAQRAADAPGTPGRVKVMFADNELAAEDLLSQVREAPPHIAEDD
ncbi:MAG: hypothetical protein KF683_12480 [Rubrivivax sp.]|nr:hypothetical protein [Rubrivivax sp.]